LIDFTQQHFGLLSARGTFAYSLELVGYYVVRSIVLALPTAIVLVPAMIELGRRDRTRGPNLADTVRFVGVTALYVICFIAPMGWLQYYLVSTPSIYLSRTMLTTIVGFGLFFVQALVLFRFSFVWPDVMATERFSVFRTFKLTGQRYWRIASV